MEIKRIKEIAYINKECLNNKSNIKYINYLDTANITKGKIDNIVKININEIPSRAKRIVKKNDIIYSTVRPNLCHYGILRDICENMVVSTGFCVLSCKSNMNPEYLYGFLSLPVNTDKLNAIAETTTSTYPSIRPNDIENMEIPVPKMDIQDKISHILSIIDKKIVENNTTNNNLLDISKLLYKQWFVNFEFPNKYGKPYQSSGGKMINSILGEIPNEWNVVTIEDLKLDISDGNYSGKYPTKKEFMDSGIPFIRGTDFNGLSISRKGLMFISEEKHAELKKGHLKMNDILITTRGEIGKIAFVPAHFIDANINAQLVRINGGKLYPKPFLGNALLSEKIQNDINSLVTGSALQQLPVGKLKQIKLVIPQDNSIIEKFNEYTCKLFEQINELEDENEILTQLRDTLLPKLMNGEIDLENIEI